jgi:hypothetical protein
VSICKKATFNAGEEGAENPKGSSETITVHPTYSECFISIPAGNSAATVSTPGCNYVLKAKTPSTPGGEIKVVCAAGKEIEVTDNTVPACKTTVGSQILKGAEYINEGAPPKRLRVGSDVEGIKWSTAGCGVASSGADGQYREGELVLGVAKLAPAGRPAFVLAEGQTEAAAPDGVEVS